MKRFLKKAANAIFILFVCFMITSFCYTQEVSQLIKYFESRSIPVDEIKMEGKVVVARINYGMDVELDEAKMEKTILAVSKKMAEEFSQSETIRLKYCVEGEEIYALDFVTADVREGLEGKKRDEVILGEMDIDMYGGEKREESVQAEKPGQGSGDSRKRGELSDSRGKIAERVKSKEDLKGKTPPRYQEMLETARQTLIRKDYDKAISQFRKTLDFLPQQSLQGLGLCYYYKRYYDDAFYYFAKAYRVNPRSPLTLFYLSATLDHWGRGQEAVFCFETYLQLQDSDKHRREIAHRRLGYLKSRLRRPRYSLYRTVDEVIYVILGDEIN